MSASPNAGDGDFLFESVRAGWRRGSAPIQLARGFDACLCGGADFSRAVPAVLPGQRLAPHSAPVHFAHDFSPNLHTLLTAKV